MSTPDFAGWFGYQLKNRKMTGADFHHASGVPRATVYTWLKGTRTPDPSSCDTISDVLGIDLDLVLRMADHRPNIEEVEAGDPRYDLIAMVKQIDWNEERVKSTRALLSSFPKRKR